MKDERRSEINEWSAEKRADVIDHLVRLNASTRCAQNAF